MNKKNVELPEMVRDAVTKSLQDLLPSLLQSSPVSAEKTKEYLNVAEAAEYTRLAKQTIYQKVSMRIIPFIKRGGRVIFKKAELQEWLDSGSKKWVRE